MTRHLPRTRVADKRLVRSLLLRVAGLLLLAAVLLLAKLFSPNYPDALRFATIGYVALWLIIASANMWVGVAKGGYSVADELPIFLLIFAVPAALAVLLKWRFLLAAWRKGPNTA